MTNMVLRDLTKHCDWWTQRLVQSVHCSLTSTEPIRFWSVSSGCSLFTLKLVRFLLSPSDRVTHSPKDPPPGCEWPCAEFRRPPGPASQIEAPMLRQRTFHGPSVGIDARPLPSTRLHVWSFIMRVVFSESLSSEGIWKGNAVPLPAGIKVWMTLWGKVSDSPPVT